ncbi:hypothetical protein HMI54_000341 [Coelomomyces lativittatus]|nr:hypothetical protein HMI55_006612 [Coelomomyces lativittatus]KAJ1512030.1 hypothetical protein HMI54_000341 [Coelomomyces lativittatus]
MEFTNALLESLSLTQTSQTLASCRRFERESVEKIRRRLSHAHKIHKVETPEPASKEVNLVDHLRRNEKIKNMQEEKFQLQSVKFQLRNRERQLVKEKRRQKEMQKEIFGYEMRRKWKEEELLKDIFLHSKNLQKQMEIETHRYNREKIEEIKRKEKAVKDAKLF